jgi:DNA-binding MarR family transcriptional regulator
MPDAILLLDDFLPYRLSYTSNRVSSRIAQTYESLFGLTIPQWRLIAIIAEREAITQQMIGTLTGMDKVTVSRATADLSARALIMRTSHPDDKRSQLLSLTKTGRMLYADIAPKAREMEAAIFASLTQGEQDQLKHLLRKIDAAII